MKSNIYKKLFSITAIGLMLTSIIIQGNKDDDTDPIPEIEPSTADQILDQDTEA